VAELLLRRRPASAQQARSRSRTGPHRLSAVSPRAQNFLSCDDNAAALAQRRAELAAQRAAQDFAARNRRELREASRACAEARWTAAEEVRVTARRWLASCAPNEQLLGPWFRKLSARR